jgi:hypothetical protein
MSAYVTTQSLGTLRSNSFPRTAALALGCRLLLLGWDLDQLRADILLFSHFNSLASQCYFASRFFVGSETNLVGIHLRCGSCSFLSSVRNRCPLLYIARLVDQDGNVYRRTDMDRNNMKTAPGIKDKSQTVRAICLPQRMSIAIRCSSALLP